VTRAPGTYATLETSQGSIVCRLFEKEAPQTVANFIGLAEGAKEFTDPRTGKKEKRPFFDGLAFHRVIPNFMIQGGDPLTKDPAKEEMWGTGDPGYKVKAEFNDKSHVRGVISMARSADPDSAGSQFFICHGSPTQLDHKYTAFGKLIKGDDVLEKIATTPTHSPDRPNTRQGIESIKIVPADSIK
jgi:peptidyl-prolyl cis-trans isomerase B (cyclophilin B)